MDLLESAFHFDTLPASSQEHSSKHQQYLHLFGSENPQEKSTEGFEWVEESGGELLHPPTQRRSLGRASMSCRPTGRGEYDSS